MKKLDRKLNAINKRLKEIEATPKSAPKTTPKAVSSASA